MDIFVHFPYELQISLDIIEDAINVVLDGEGEVADSDTSQEGSQISIEIYEGDPFEYVKPICRALRKLKVPHDTYLMIDDEPIEVYQE